MKDQSTKEILKEYQTKDYLEAYASHTDARAVEDAEEAIGGMWQQMGEHQLSFLVRKGLLPENNLLDIGCGTLRGGLRFIEYLEKGNYTGFDISEKVIEIGRRKIEEQGLVEKEPRIFLNSGKDLTFRGLESETFDFILAQSVFTHLFPEHIQECFENVGKIMSEESRFYFTFKPGPPKRLSLKDFQYPLEHFREWSEQSGLVLEDLSEEYAHPRGQGMLCARLKFE